MGTGGQLIAWGTAWEAQNPSVEGAARCSLALWMGRGSRALPQAFHPSSHRPQGTWPRPCLCRWIPGWNWPWPQEQVGKGEGQQFLQQCHRLLLPCGQQSAGTWGTGPRTAGLWILGAAPPTQPQKASAVPEWTQYSLWTWSWGPWPACSEVRGRVTRVPSGGCWPGPATPAPKGQREAGQQELARGSSRGRAMERARHSGPG